MVVKASQGILFSAYNHNIILQVQSRDEVTFVCLKSGPKYEGKNSDMVLKSNMSLQFYNKDKSHKYKAHMILS